MVKKLNATIEKCEGCGGNLVFCPNTLELTCEKCGKEQKFDKQKLTTKRNLNFDFQEDNYNKWVESNKVIQCKSCGARIVLNKLEYASNCPYCQSSFVSLSEELPGITPDGIIPFEFDGDEALHKFKAQVKKRFYVPRAIKKSLPRNKVSGVYIPSFSFDLDSKSSYKGVLIKTQTYFKDGKSYTREFSFPISGKINLPFRDIMVEASSQITQKQLSQILPFNSEKAYKFEEDFIRGYVVEHYNEDLKTCFEQAKQIVDPNIRREILKKYAYSRVQYLDIDTKFYNEKFIYNVSPIYIFEYNYKKKQYVTLMNGQTGKLGKGLPISKIKVAFTVLIILLFIAGVVALSILYSN